MLLRHRIGVSLHSVRMHTDRGFRHISTGIMEDKGGGGEGVRVGGTQAERRQGQPGIAELNRNQTGTLYNEAKSA